MCHSYHTHLAFVTFIVYREDCHHFDLYKHFFVIQCWLILTSALAACLTESQHYSYIVSAAFDLVQKYEEWFENGTSGIRKTGVTNPPPPYEIDIVRGSAYGIFSRKFVEFVINNQRAKDLLEWSQNTLSPDEHYWATLHNTFYNPHLNTPGRYTGFLWSHCYTPWFVVY